MSEYADFQDKIRRYFTFTRVELNNLITSIIIIGFIVSFKDWVIADTGTLDMLLTLRNILNGILISSIVMLIYESTSRIWALWIGFKVESKIWWPGLITGLVIAFASKGSLWFIVAPGIFIQHLAIHRIGSFRYGLNMMANGMICLAGIGAVIIFALFTKILLIYLPSNILLLKVLHISLWFAVVNMLPIPPLSGSRIFFMSGSPLPYIFTFFTVIGFTVFLSITITHLWMMWLLILGSFVIGTIVWMLYLSYWHNK